MELGGNNYSNTIVGRTLYFPEPIKTEKIKINIEEGDFPVLLKIDFLGSSAEMSYWADPALEPRLIRNGECMFVHWLQIHKANMCLYSKIH